ncbi:hypothetical protein ABBQ38_012684 [Trebouxia sp. C0009 RCD-2024]
MVGYGASSTTVRHSAFADSAHVKALGGGAVVRASQEKVSSPLSLALTTTPTKALTPLEILCDGKCRHKAIALGLVLAVAQRPEGTKTRFVLHQDDVYTVMQREQQLMQYCSRSKRVCMMQII